MHQEWRNLEIRNVYLSSHKETRGYLNVTNSAFVPFFHRWWLPLIRLLITGITWSTILPVSCFQCYYFQEEWHLRKIWGLHLFKGRCKLAVNICNSVSIFKKNTFQILSPWIRKQLHLVYLVFDSSHFKERQGLYPLIIVQACASKKKKKKFFPNPCRDQYVYPEAPEIWWRLLWFADSQQAWFCRLDSGNRIPPVSRETVPK